MSKYICNTQESVIQDWFIFWDNFVLLHKTSFQRLQPSYLFTTFLYKIDRKCKLFKLNPFVPNAPSLYP